MYKKYWNRNDKVNKKMKSLTFRNINIISFNVMFFLMHIGLAGAAYFNKQIGGELKMGDSWFWMLDTEEGE